jgi:hypothetical protein
MFKGKAIVRSPMERSIGAGFCINCGGFIRPVLNAGPSPKTGKRFCPDCGVQVWTVCPCGKHLRYDDPVCTDCGRQNLIFLQRTKAQA